MLLRMCGPSWPAPYMAAAALPMSLLRGGLSLAGQVTGLGSDLTPFSKGRPAWLGPAPHSKCPSYSSPPATPQGLSF